MTMPQLYQHKSSLLPNLDLRSTTRQLQWETVWDIDSEYVQRMIQPIESDHPVYLFLRLMYWEAYVSERELKEIGFKYHISLVASSPGFAGDKNILQALESGIGEENLKEMSQSEIAWELVQYGTTATLWQKQGNNKRQLIREAKRESLAINTLFGFYVDRPQNAIGSTGWDFMAGDIMRGLRNHD